MKLDLVLENTRNKYKLGLLEESEGMSEKDLLKGKIMINEATMDIRKMLVENGVMQQTKDILEESFTIALIEEFFGGGSGPSKGGFIASLAKHNSFGTSSSHAVDSVKNEYVNKYKNKHQSDNDTIQFDKNGNIIDFGATGASGVDKHPKADDLHWTVEETKRQIALNKNNPDIAIKGHPDTFNESPADTGLDSESAAMLGMN